MIGDASMYKNNPINPVVLVSKTKLGSMIVNNKKVNGAHEEMALNSLNVFLASVSWLEIVARAPVSDFLLSLYIACNSEEEVQAILMDINIAKDAQTMGSQVNQFVKASAPKLAVAK